MLTVYWIMFGLGVSFTLVSALLSGDASHQGEVASDGLHVDGHALDAPAADVPSLEAPALEAPAVEAPTLEAPAAELPAHVEIVPAAAELPAHVEVAPADAGLPVPAVAEVAHGHGLAPKVDLRAAVEHVHNALGPALTASSPLSISVFCAAFGGFGLVWTKFFGALFVAAGAVSALLAAMGTAAAALAFFNRLFASVQSDSTVQLDHLAGVDAVVVLDVPENGVGTVSFEAGGRRHTSPARSLSGRVFPLGARVSILRADQGLVYIDHPLDRRQELLGS